MVYRVVQTRITDVSTRLIMDAHICTHTHTQAVFEHISCFLGPRHEHKLVYTTVTAIVLMIVASMVPWLLRRAVRGKRIAQHDSNLIAVFSLYCSKGQLILIFLVYPALTQTIMRTFVCKKYAEDDTGNPTWWLVDDTMMQCVFFTPSRVLPGIATNITDAVGEVVGEAVSDSSSYMFIVFYSWFMVAIVVIGFPAFLFKRLWYVPYTHVRA